MDPFTNSSETQTINGIVSDPDGRGTITIVWSCLVVVVLNTWTVIHPNIQPIAFSDGRKWLHKVNLAVIAAFAPDAVAATAFSQWRAARRSYKDLKKDLPWWTMQHAFYGEMGGYRVVDRISGQQFAVRHRELAWLHRRKRITIPPLDKKQLEERSKSEPIGRFVALCQSTWFLATSIARFNQRLPLTTLEVELVPFIFVTWIIYFWWWKKPMELQTITEVHIDNLLPNEITQMARATCCFDANSPWWRPMPQEMHPLGWDYFWMTKPVDMRKCRFINTTHLIPSSVRDVVRMTLAEWQVADWYRPSVNEAHPNEWDEWDGWVIYLVGIWLYGVPLIAWDYEFPTKIESILWKTANLGSIVLITLWGPVGFALYKIGSNPGAAHKESYYYLAVILVFLGRLYVVVEIFMGLRSCPAAVYSTVDWSMYLPHI
ncbi:hypothetical protein GGR51DRAFT_531437 [Nemania sp. FL0031]|nr:hypothetical protein GGR51DRAFT_531437 [Nemania sp. FL0031]